MLTYRCSWLSISLGMCLLLSGCTPAPSSGKGFTLPHGNADTGEQIFVQLKCHACHTVAGDSDLPDVEDREMSIRLGGKVSRIGTYGELVTAIINPSHRLAKGHLMDDVSTDGESRMKNYNDVLTVSQLIDLVAFLQSRYTLREYQPTQYPVYY